VLSCHSYKLPTRRRLRSRRCKPAVVEL
jgi:hypothetical protein